MAESIEELREQRNQLQIKANDLKDKRNQLHATSKKLAEERDSVNSTIRNLRNETTEHKNKRDELNERVKHAKDQRDILNEKCQEIKKQIRIIERQRSNATGTNLVALRKQLHTLETEQMTEPMSPRKEKKLIETISGLHSKIKKQEAILNEDPKLKKALEEEKTYKRKAEKQHDNVEALASRAQQEHEIMVGLITKLDNLTKRVNEIQENIITTKIQADDVHREFITHVDKIHEIERVITTEKDQHLKKKKRDEESSMTKEANEIFERFRKGEKLSTEDLMALQKAGLI
jgi:uncharacterized coiled-coil DUF342 family protein